MEGAVFHSCSFFHAQAENKDQHKGVCPDEQDVVCSSASLRKDTWEWKCTHDSSMCLAVLVADIMYFWQSVNITGRWVWTEAAAISPAYEKGADFIEITEEVKSDHASKRKWL